MVILLRIIFIFILISWSYESVYQSILPSFVPLLGSLLGQCLCAFALLLVYLRMTGIADAHEVVPHECPLAHLCLRCRFLDGVAVMHGVGTGYDMITLAHLAQRVGSQLQDAQLPPLSAVVYLRLVLLLLWVMASP